LDGEADHRCATRAPRVARDRARCGVITPTAATRGRFPHTAGIVRCCGQRISNAREAVLVLPRGSVAVAPTM
jgi:hypothetical protein